MNLIECSNILSRRQESKGDCIGCNCSEKDFFQNVLNASNLKKTSAISRELSNLSSADLLNLFTNLQGDRCETFLEYNAVFKKLVEDNNIYEYQFLCEYILHFSVK